MIQRSPAPTSSGRTKVRRTALFACQPASFDIHVDALQVSDYPARLSVSGSTPEIETNSVLIQGPSSSSAVGDSFAGGIARNAVGINNILSQENFFRVWNATLFFASQNHQRSSTVPESVMRGMPEPKFVSKRSTDASTYLDASRSTRSVHSALTVLSTTAPSPVGLVPDATMSRIASPNDWTGPECAERWDGHKIEYGFPDVPPSVLGIM
jgi:hypothetical protein